MNLIPVHNKIISESILIQVSMCLLCLFSLIISDATLFQVHATYEQNTTNKDLTLPILFKKVNTSVVQIATTVDMSQGTSPLQGTVGSGLVYDNLGHIVTNSHVAIPNRDSLYVTFWDGTVYRARLIGADQFTDLAVLELQSIPFGKLLPQYLGNSAGLLVGQKVAAIGNPFGLSASLSRGIISGIGRLLPAGSGIGSQYPATEIIQTDAPINPGNSGGPLLDMKGRVIGITSTIFSTAEEFSGVGFAIPSNTVKKVVLSLIKNGSYQHPWLGIIGFDITPEASSRLGLKDPRGVLVANVAEGSPALKSGIRGGTMMTNIGGKLVPLGGDVILKADNIPVGKIEDILIHLERDKEVGDNINLTILRNGLVQEIVVVLGPRPSTGS